VRLVVRRDSIAWVVVALLYVGLLYGSYRSARPSAGAIVPLVFSALYVFIWLWLMRKQGVLGVATGMTVAGLLGRCPLTLDMSRWYAWRQWETAAVVVALALWGFRNVLGKQSAFPAGALDG
jgi:hypothetical protein